MRLIIDMYTDSLQLRKFVMKLAFWIAFNLIHCGLKLSGLQFINEVVRTSEYIGVLSDELDELVDGGDSEELNADIQFSQPQDAMQLRQQLLNESPYLSDTVMKIGHR